MIRVVHVLQNLNYGGMEKLLADMAAGFPDDRVETHVLTLQYQGRFSDDMTAHATLHEAGPMSRLSMLWPRELAKDIEAVAPDIVHTHSGVWYKASLAARLARVPFVVHTDHGRTPPDPWRNRVLDRLGSHRTDTVVAVSDRLAEHLRSAGIVTHRTPIRIIRNAVDTDRFRPDVGRSRLREELGLDRDRPIIGSVGRLEPVKAYDVLIRAFAQTHRAWDRGAAPALVLAGDGSHRQYLRDVAAKAGVDGSVHILGWRDDIRDLLASYTVFAMSSESEGTSVSLLEAMSSGLCPVVTDVGGNRAVLGDCLAHRLVPPGDPEALARALQDACADIDARARDEGVARARIEEQFSLHRMLREYLDLYTTLAES